MASLSERAQHPQARLIRAGLLSGLLAVFACAGVLSAADKPLDGQVSMTLWDAVFQDAKDRAGKPTYLGLDCVCRNGQWEPDVYGWAWNFNRSDHFGKIQQVKTDGDRVVLDLLLEIDGDQWIPGGLANYRIEAAMREGKLSGTFRGKFRGKQLSGKVEGSIAPFPEVRKGYIPPEPGEHPRLLIRRSDIPELQKKAQTEWGRKLIARIEAATGDGLAMGLMYNLTGQQKYADRCREILSKEMKEQSGGAFNLGHEHGRRQQRAGLILDLAWHGLDEQFRSTVAGYLWCYAARSTLRPTTFSQKTNQMPGSNYMAFVAAGGYTAQAAIWDAPGAFPIEPVAPAMVQVQAPQSFRPGQGVPVVELQPGKTITRWLFAGPLLVYQDRESDIVLSAQVEGKPRFQHFGQDFLAPLGGAAKARPEQGTKVTYKGRTATFGALSEKAIVKSDGGEAIDVWAAHHNVPCSAGYYYTVLDNQKSGWYTVRLEGPAAADAGKVNVYIGATNEKLTPQTVAPRLDATLYLAGRALHEGDAVHLEVGAYPAMLRATTRQYQIRLQPRFEPTTEADAKQSLAVRQERFDKENPVWDTFAEGYYRRPLMNICRRKALRTDKFAQGDGGYKNESGSYHGYTLPSLLLLGNAYLNHSGTPLPNGKMSLPCYTVTDEGNDHTFAVGFATVPDEYKPAVLWAWKQKKDFGQDALFQFLNYPPDMEPKNPQGVLPNPYADRQQGFYVFRNGWKGSDTISAAVYFKGFAITGWNRPCHGTFDIRGLGHVWAWRGDERAGDRFLEENVVLFPQDPTAVNDVWHTGPGRVTSFAGKPDGSGTLSGHLDEVLVGLSLGEKGKLARATDEGGLCIQEHIRDLGIRDHRSFAADYSGSCGAPALLAVVDKTKGGKRKYWQMLLPENRNVKPDVAIQGQTFTIRQGDASLKGTVVAPAAAKVILAEPGTKVDIIDGLGKPGSKTLTHPAIWVEGGDDFFVVMTLQKGPAPEVQCQGKGLDARVTVGRRTLRFDGRNIVIGE